ncbi:TRAP transporter small permease [Acuticoccus sp. M5D2P5]|uniref:TRAP transporter small permease n=1 Tax=Acuticoccus kalidii TaxID=2910977 RepID=UPI001F2A8FC2|nr:TRAP transporter small permease [Acuticoccus kalidii]MCF3936691.1 TRAP transporter small permease [Acuticoccus kalidii]
MRLLANAEKILCAVILAAMTGIGFANVVVRYLTDRSFAATEEILVNGFLLLTILGAAIAARRGEHLAVTLVFDLLPVRVRILALHVTTVLAAMLLFLSAWFSWQLVSHQIQSGTVSYALLVPAWWYTIGLPFGFLLVLVRYLEHAWRIHRELAQEIAADA